MNCLVSSADVRGSFSSNLMVVDIMKLLMSAFSALSILLTTSGKVQYLRTIQSVRQCTVGKLVRYSYVIEATIGDPNPRNG